MIVRNLHLLLMIIIIFSILAGSLLITFIKKDDKPNFITTPKPKIVYHQSSYNELS